MRIHIESQYDNKEFAMEKKPCFFIFFKIANTPHKGTIGNLVLLHVSSFLIKIQCFYRDENDLVPDDQHSIRAKRNTSCLATILKNDNSSCL